jgi:hypothetical protein
MDISAAYQQENEGPAGWHAEEKTNAIFGKALVPAL